VPETAPAPQPCPVVMCPAPVPCPTYVCAPRPACCLTRLFAWRPRGGCCW
jgi:hypothetical protein